MSMSDNTNFYNLLNKWKKVSQFDIDPSRVGIEEDILFLSSSLKHEVTCVLYCALIVPDDKFDRLCAGETVYVDTDGLLNTWTKQYDVCKARSIELAEVYGYNSAMVAYNPSALSIVLDYEQLRWMRGTDSFKNQDVICKSQSIMLNTYNTNRFHYSEFLK